MRILFVAPLDSIHSKRWISYFVEKNHDVHVISNSDDIIEIPDIKKYILKPPVRKVPLLLNFREYGRFNQEIKKTINEINPDLIHIHWINTYAYRIVTVSQKPIIATAWGSDILISPEKYLRFKWAIKRTLKKVNILTCDAVHLRDRMVRLGANKDKIHIIFFGTNLKEFNPGKRDISLRTELGFNPDCKLIISLRALRPIYNVETFIRAIPIVVNQFQNVNFVVVGDGDERKMLEQLSCELGINDKIKFVGRLSDDQLQRYTASADIYVSTSLSDGGLAASTAEAMACEVPVVITDFGNNRDWVEHNKTGLLFPLKDYNKLAENIIYLLRNSEIARQLGQEGMKIIKERNNYHKEMQKVEDLYVKMIAIGK